jgi:aminoglycoside phosphotransferase (APT) family kinase protein
VRRYTGAEKLSMNQPDPAAPRLSPEEISAALGAWLPTQLRGTPVEVTGLVAPKGTGFSNQTCLFNARWHGADHALVLQAAPRQQGLFARYDFASMARVQQRLGEVSTVPVARVRWHEADPTVLGVPFYIMDRVPGRAPTDKPPYHREGWFAGLSADEHARAWWSGIEAMAALHALDVESDGFGFLTDSPWGMAIDADPARTRIEQWRAFLAWADPEPLAVVDAALDELERTRPTPPPKLRVHWGDAKLSNCMVHEARVHALLDWELCGLSVPEEDLAHWLMLDWSLWAVTRCTRLPSLPSPAHTVARYQELSGRDSNDVLWWFRFGAVRLAIIYHRIMHLVRARGHVPPGKTLAEVNPIAPLLAPLFDTDKLP